MATLKFKITGCTDHLMWYSDCIGQLAPYVAVYTDCYMSREPAGYTNIIKHEDAELVIVDENDNILRTIDFDPKTAI